MLRILKNITEFIVRHGTVMKDPLRMPLETSISSDEHSASFFSGENIMVMNGTIVSPDSSIGANTYVGFNCHITKSKIGRYVSIADRVLVGPGEHSLNRVSTSACFYENPYEAFTQEDTTIHDDVWIGAGSIIRRGVVVGYGAVVGANSFVNQDVPPFAIVAGSPARILRYRFDDRVQERIRASLWSSLPVHLAKAKVEEIENQYSD